MIHQFYSKICILKGEENMYPYKNLHMNVHGSITHNSPQMETVQLSIS